MRTVKFTCNRCGVKIKADAELGGDTISCPSCGNAILIPMPGIRSGMIIANYRLERRLGVGGMGEVWLARQIGLDRMVALKILSPVLTRDEQFVARFLNEAKVAGQLAHQHIVTAYDAGVEDNIHYLATSYIEGEELDRMLQRRKRLTEREALWIAGQLADALRYAYTRFELLHRDIKPGNIIIDREGDAHLMDLGISKSRKFRKGAITQEGHFVGTPHYMSPEQARGDSKISLQSDIYSLGATLYHMVTGKVPFEAETVMGVLTRHLTEPPPNPQRLNAELSNPCAALLDIMLAKNPLYRQPTWDAVVEDIRRVVDGDFPLTSCPPDSRYRDAQKVVGRLGRGRRKRLPPAAAVDRFRLPVAAGLLAVLLAALGGLLWLSDAERARSGGSDARKAGASPPPGGTDSAAASPGAREDEPQSAWAYAVAYADRTIAATGNFERAISHFETLRTTLVGTRYAFMADEQIDRLELERTLARQSVIRRLEAAAERLARQGDPRRAAEFLAGYEGALAEETDAYRAERSSIFLQRAEQLEQRRKQEAEERERQARDIREQTLDRVLESRFREAADRLGGLSGDLAARLEPDRILMDELADANTSVLRSFEPQRGERIVLDIASRVHTVIVAAVHSSSVLLDWPVAGGVISREITPADLTPEERLRRLDGLSSDARAVLRGLYHLHAGDRTQAEMSFAASETWGDALLERLAERDRSARLADLRTRMKSLARLAGLAEETAEWVPVEPLPPLPADRRRAVDEAIAALREEYSAGELEAWDLFLAWLGRAAAPGKGDLQTQLRGAITEYDPETRFLEVRYDFLDPAELADWQPLTRASPWSGSEPRLENGELVLSGIRNEASRAVFLPEFESLQVHFMGSYDEAHLETFLLHGEGMVGMECRNRRSGRDGYTVLDGGRGRRSIPLWEAGHEPGAHILGHLDWDGATLQPSVNNRLWPSLPLTAKSVRFGVAGLGAPVRFTSIVVRGVVSAEWLARDPAGDDSEEPWRERARRLFDQRRGFTRK
jgi:serine/threonine protein kinase